MNKMTSVNNIIEEVKFRQFGQSFDGAKFLICNLGYGGYGGQFSLRILAFQLATYFDRVLIFNYHDYIYDECYDSISNFSYDDIKDLESVKLDFDKNQKDKVVFFDFDSYWSNEKLRDQYHEWLPTVLIQDGFDYRYFYGLLSSFFVLKDEYKNKIEDIKKRIGFKNPIIGMHVRRGDKIVESEHISLATYVDALIRAHKKTGINRVFVTSDSSKTIKELPQDMGFEYIYDYEEKRYNNAMHRFLRQRPELVKQETLTAAKILELLGSCSFVVGQENTHFSVFGACMSYFRLGKKDNQRLLSIRKHIGLKRSVIISIYSYFDKVKILIGKYILNKKYDK